MFSEHASSFRSCNLKMFIEVALNEKQCSALPAFLQNTQPLCMRLQTPMSRPAFLGIPRSIAGWKFPLANKVSDLRSAENREDLTSPDLRSIHCTTGKSICPLPAQRAQSSAPPGTLVLYRGCFMRCLGIH